MKKRLESKPKKKKKPRLIKNQKKQPVAKDETVPKELKKQAAAADEATPKKSKEATD